MTLSLLHNCRRTNLVDVVEGNIDDSEEGTSRTIRLTQIVVGDLNRVFVDRGCILGDLAHDALKGNHDLALRCLCHSNAYLGGGGWRCRPFATLPFSTTVSSIGLMLIVVPTAGRAKGRLLACTHRQEQHEYHDHQLSRSS